MSLIEDIRPELSEGTVVRSRQRRLRPVVALVALALVAALAVAAVLALGGEPTARTAPTPPVGDAAPQPAPEGRTSGDDTTGATADDPAAEGSTSDKTSSGSSSGTSSDKTSSGSSSGTTTKVSAVTTVSAAKAASRLRSAGVTPLGTVRDAMTWTDRNGRNLLVASVATRTTTGGNGTELRSATIRVVHVAGVGTAHPKVLRTMTDPSGEPCEFDFTHQVDRDFGIAGDLDGDGYAEVSVAWSSSCLSDASPSVAKVALLSNGRKFILRGTGWPAGLPDGPGSYPEAQIEDVEPGPSAWPADFYQRTKLVFFKLYG
jgi:hypothetical protein